MVKYVQPVHVYIDKNYKAVCLKQEYTQKRSAEWHLRVYWCDVLFSSMDLQKFTVYFFHEQFSFLWNIMGALYCNVIGLL